MASSPIRNRFLTTRLVTMLLPGMALLAPSMITPRSDFGIIAPWELSSVSAATAAPSSERWSRRTFVLFQTEATRPVRLTEVSPSTAVPVAKAAAPKPLPGTVQNLRRADTP